MKNSRRLTLLVVLLVSVVGSSAFSQTDEKSKSTSSAIRQYYDFDKPTESEISPNPSRGVGPPPRLFVFGPVARIGPPSSNYSNIDINGRFSEVGGSGGDLQAAIRPAPNPARPANPPPAPRAEPAPARSPPPQPANVRPPEPPNREAPPNNQPERNANADGPAQSDREMLGNIARQVESGDLSSLDFQPSEAAQQDERVLQGEQQRYREVSGRIARELQTQIATTDAPNADSQSRNPSAKNSAKVLDRQRPRIERAVRADMARQISQTGTVGAFQPSARAARNPQLARTERAVWQDVAGKLAASLSRQSNGNGRAVAGRGKGRQRFGNAINGHGGSRFGRGRWRGYGGSQFDNTAAPVRGVRAPIQGGPGQIASTVNPGVANPGAPPTPGDGSPPSSDASASNTANPGTPAGSAPSETPGGTESMGGGADAAGTGGTMAGPGGIGGMMGSMGGFGGMAGFGMRPGGASARMAPAPPPPRPASPASVQSSSPGRLALNPAPPPAPRTMPLSAAPRASLQPASVAPSGAAAQPATAQPAPNAASSSSPPAASSSALAQAERVARAPAPSASASAAGAPAVRSESNLSARPSVAGLTSARMAPAPPPPPAPTSPAPIQSAVPGRLALNSMPTSLASRTPPNSAALHSGIQPGPIPPVGGVQRPGTPTASSASKGPSTAAAHPQGAAEGPSASASKGLPGSPNGAMRPASANGGGNVPMWCNAITGKCTPAGSGPPPRPSPQPGGGSHPCGPIEPGATAVRECDSGPAPSQGNSGGSHNGNVGSRDGNPPRPTTSIAGANPTNMPATLPWLQNGYNPLFGPMQPTDGGAQSGDPLSPGNGPGNNIPSDRPSSNSMAGAGSGDQSPPPGNGGSSGSGDRSGSDQASSMGNPGTGDQPSPAPTNSANNATPGEQPPPAPANSANNTPPGDQPPPAPANSADNTAPANQPSSAPANSADSTAPTNQPLSSPANSADNTAPSEPPSSAPASGANNNSNLSIEQLQAEVNRNTQKIAQQIRDDAARPPPPPPDSFGAIIGFQGCLAGVGCGGRVFTYEASGINEYRIDPSKSGGSSQIGFYGQLALNPQQVAGGESTSVSGEAFVVSVSSKNGRPDKTGGFAIGAGYGTPGFSRTTGVKIGSTNPQDTTSTNVQYNIITDAQGNVWAQKPNGDVRLLYRATP